MAPWMFLLALMALLTTTTIGAPVTDCPKLCICTPSGTLRCHSFSFLRKLSPDQADAVATLEVIDAAKTVPDLSHFRNLKRLTLASKIHSLSTAHLPQTVEFLNLSRNSITHLPSDIHHLSALREINLYGNPLSCSCDSLHVREALLKKGVTVAKATCETPEELRGKPWTTVVCRASDSLFGEMQGDGPDEGSGFGSNEVITESDPVDVEKWDSTIEEEEYIRVNHSQHEAPEVPPEEQELEGSGEPDVKETTQSASEDYEDETTEDYSDYAIPVATEAPVESVNVSVLEQARIKACNFNCSTPAPLPDSNDTNPAPNFIEGFKIIINDIVGEPETAKTTEAAVVDVDTTSVKEVSEAPVVTENRARAYQPSPSSDAEIINNDLNVNATKENFDEPQQSNSTFIFLAVLLLVVICLVIYAFVKKRSLRRNLRNVSQQKSEKPDEEKIPEEMELIKKSPENDKPNGTHETTIPLMNGHNETSPKDEDVTETKEDNEEVELRLKVEEKTALTPEAKRVTIKASEIPNSTPQTPILVTRHVGSDGNVVTTPTVDQNI